MKNEIEIPGHLLEALTLDDAFEREAAVDAAWTVGGPLSRATARIGVTDSSSVVRMTAVEALGEDGNAQDLFAVRMATKDKHWAVRAAAVASLADIGGMAVRKEVESIVARDREPVVRHYGAVALAGIAGKQAIPFLESRLAVETDARGRAGLLHGLALLRHPTAAKTMAEEARDWHWLDQQSAISSLQDVLEKGRLSKAKRRQVHRELAQLASHLPERLQEPLAELVTKLEDLEQ